MFGKALGNGFPISGVATTRQICKYMKDTIPGSTYAGNGLACAVACGVLDVMNQQDFTDKAAQLERFFFDYFSQSRLQSCGIKLDGMGGLLSISFNDPSFDKMQEIYLNILKKGVIVLKENT